MFIPRRSARRVIIITLAISLLLCLGHRIAAPHATSPSSLKEEEEWRTGTNIHSRGFSRCPDGRNRHTHKVFNVKREDDEQELEEHTYRNDGLLDVNPNGEHPIFELIRRAEEEWQKKLNKASTTLEQAVAEYKLRYKRLPPLGFDHWWAYVEKHNVQLPDEYDQIYNDLEHFWGMDPNDLQSLQRDWEAHVDSFTVGKDSLEDMIDLKNFSLPGYDPRSPDGLARGAYQIIRLLEEVEQFIPPFRAVFSPHDNPNLPTDFELKQQALKAAAMGKYIDIHSPPEVKLEGWISGCPPDSPARKEQIPWEGTPQPQLEKTFIYDHRRSMDPCQHPSHLLLHGQFISHRKGPVPPQVMIPQFSYCPTMMHHDITPAMPINWIEDINREDDPVWEDRSDERLQWRGSNTGIWHARNIRWDLAQRTRLVRWADGDSIYDGNSQGAGDNLTVLLPAKEGKRVGEGMTVKRTLWTAGMVDVAFAGQTINCPPEVCYELQQVFEFRRPQYGSAAGRYKYVMDVDGNGWSSRFKRLITSNALVFKSTIYPEWFLDRVAPWVHYVPIQNDLSDLWDAFAFFRGDPSGHDGHDELAKHIAEAGREWSKTFWRMEDLTAYMFRLFLEYARVMDPERPSYGMANEEPTTQQH